MNSKAGIVVLSCLLGTSAFGAPILVTTAGALGANDSAAWGQLGGDLTTLGASFSALSVGGKAVSGAFGGGAGSVVSVVCPAAPSCSWIPSGTGFSAGDSLIVTSNANGGATGPLSLSFPAVLGAGLEIQVDQPGTYTAQILGFNGASQIASFTEASNGSGDPLFIGLLDTVADITKITVNLSVCGGLGCNVNDFAVDTLLLKQPVITGGTPEPSSMLLFGGGLAALLGWRKRRNAASRMSFVGPIFGKEQ